MKNWVTKKNVLWITLLGTTIIGLYFVLVETGFCYRSWDWCRNYLWDFMKTTLPFLLIFPALLVCTLITYKLPVKVFSTWIKFSALTLPVVYFFIITSPQDAIGGGLSAAMAVTRGQAAFQLSIIFFVLSLVIIAYKFFALKKSGAGG